MGFRFDFDIDIASAEELLEGFQDAAKNCPDLLQMTIAAEKKQFIKDMKKETAAAIDETLTGNLTKGYHFEQTEKVGRNIFSDFYAEGKANPHFHLVNNGHELVKNGKVIGFVPGRRIKEPVIESWEDKHEEHTRRAMKRLVDRANR